MTKFGKFILILIIIGLVAVVLFFLQKKPAEAPAPIPPVVDNTMPPIENKDQIEGNKDDLISFSIWPGTKVARQIVSFRGVIQGNYFFEGNIPVHVLDANKMHVINTHGTATSDWMTSGPVNFEGSIDFNAMQPGTAYIELHNDNPSGDPTKDKTIRFPIVIE